MKRYIKSTNDINKDESDTQFVIAIVEDETGRTLGYFEKYCTGGQLFTIKAIVDIEYAKKYPSATKARRAKGQYNYYGQVFIYDPTSPDYPFPAERNKERENPTHLEVVAVN